MLLGDLFIHYNDADFIIDLKTYPNKRRSLSQTIGPRFAKQITICLLIIHDLEILCIYTKTIEVKNRHCQVSVQMFFFFYGTVGYIIIFLILLWRH